MTARPSFAVLILFVLFIPWCNLTAQWNPDPASDGVRVAGADSTGWEGSAAVPDGQGGVYVLWQTAWKNQKSVVYAQHLDSTGIARWGKDGLLISDTLYTASPPNAVSDGAGGFIAVWYLQQYPPPPEPDSTGTAQVVAYDAGKHKRWDKRLWPNHLYSGFAELSVIPIETDDAGGAFVMGFYGTYRTPNSAYVHHVLANGNTAQMGNGVRVRYGRGGIAGETMKKDGSGGVFIAWQDSRFAAYPYNCKDIYAQHVTAAGTAAWSNGQQDALHITSFPIYQQQRPTLELDGNGGLYLGYTNYSGGDVNNYSDDIVRILPGGTIDWAQDMGFWGTWYHGLALYFAWSMVPLGNGNIMAGQANWLQAVTTSGTLQLNGGAPVPIEADTVFLKAMLPDGAGGVYTLSDYWPIRNPIPDSAPNELRLQRISPAGIPLWQSPGKPIATSSRSRKTLIGGIPSSLTRSLSMDHPGFMDDGRGGYIVVWFDSPVPGDTGTAQICATRFNANGDIYPVELESFTAVREGESVHLQWRTAEETNNYGFTVERSVDRKHWQEIGFVHGHGTTSNPQEYEYRDGIAQILPWEYVVYYRLRQEDFDGTGTHSTVQRVELNSVDRGFTLAPVYPNPVTSSAALRFSVPDQMQAHVRVVNALGQTVYEHTDVYHRGWNSVALPMNELAPGMYTIRMETEHGTKSQIILKR